MALIYVDPRVYIEVGATINVKKYEFAKVTVGMGLDVPDDITVKEFIIELRADLIDKMLESLDEVEQAIRSLK